MLVESVLILLAESKAIVSEDSSTISSNTDANKAKYDCNEACQSNVSRENSEVTLLDLYSGCGAMSTGLCFGANLSGMNLVTVSVLY